MRAGLSYSNRTRTQLADGNFDFGTSSHVGLVAMALAIAFLVVCQSVAFAQNLGAAPQVNIAVQGQTGAQPEGVFLNFVN